MGVQGYKTSACLQCPPSNDLEGEKILSLGAFLLQWSDGGKEILFPSGGEVATKSSVEKIKKLGD